MTGRFRVSTPAACALLLAVGAFNVQSPAGASEAPAKEPEAIALLEKADEAIRELDTLSFKSHFDGLWWARGRVEGEVKLKRGSQVDNVLQQRYYDVVAEIDAIQTPAGNEGLPERFTFVMSGKDAWLVDDANKRIIHASGLDRAGMLNAATAVVLPQYYRVDPLKIEIEQSAEARLVGRDRIDGVECHVVYLKFPDDTGFGEQFLYFGVEDHLIRKATLVTRDVPGVVPAGMMQVVMSDVAVDEPLQDSLFDAPKIAGYSMTKFAAKDVDVGSMSPEWTVELLGGGRISPAQLRGDTAVLVFWASWCPSCHAFFPELEEMAEKYRNAHVRFIAINVWDTDDPQEFVDEHDPSFDIGLNGSHVANAYRFIGQPAIVVLDEKGVIRYKQLGARPATEGNPRIWAAVDTALAEQG